MSVKVYYPMGGKMFLLNWWTYNERGHIILAKTEKSLHEAARMVCKKHIFEIKNMFEIDIVAPPQRLNVLVDKLSLDSRIFRFNRMMIEKVKNAFKKGEPLPVLFSTCKKYEPDFEVDPKDDWSVESHNQCKHCIYGLKCSLNSEEFYNKYYDRWQVLYPERAFPLPKNLVESKASIASNIESLWYADANFGHHSTGATIEELDYANASEHMSSRSLFFFRKIRELDQTELTDFIEKRKENLLKIREEQTKRQREAYKNKDVKDVEEIISFFNE